MKRAVLRHVGREPVGPNFNPVTGNLPRGRWVFTLADAEARFVCGPEFATSDRRKEVWSDFRTALAAIGSLKIKVPSVFIGGTFATNKIDPSDIDATFIVDRSAIRNPATYGRLVQFVGGLRHSGLNVDGFLLLWDAEGDESLMDPGYLNARGKWDDWWQRDVAKGQRGTPVRAHSLPKRGYIEVEVDGYR
jgi:hypothetical protein